jgi:hypothetical protein
MFPVPLSVCLSYPDENPFPRREELNYSHLRLSLTPSHVLRHTALLFQPSTYMEDNPTPICALIYILFALYC